MLSQMAANGDYSSFKDEMNFTRFTSVLTSAACEWTLILLLLIDAAFSYLLTKFACYCKLQIPCVFCSRLDRVLGKEKPDFYQNLLCSMHRSEISYLLSCQIHDNLADGRGMCEDCVLSLAMKNKPDPDMHRLLPRKIGFDLRGWDLMPHSVSTKLCSCCRKPWRNRQNVQRMLQLRPPGDGLMSKPNIPLPRRLSPRGSLKKMKLKIPAVPQNHATNGYDHMSHVGYTELKIHSDVDSEFPFSDDDSMTRGAHTKDKAEEESDFQSASEALQRKFSGKLPPRKRSDHHSSITMPPVTVPCSKQDVEYPPKDEKTCPVLLPELISLDDIPPALSPAEVPVEVLPVSQTTNASPLSELIHLVEARPSSTPDVHPSKPVTENPNLNGADENKSMSINSHKEILSLYGANSGVGISNEIVNYPSPKDSSFSTQNGQWQATESSKDREASELVLEHSLSATSHDIRVHGGQEWKAEVSNATESQDLQQSETMDGNLGTDHAGPESFDGSTVSDIEGENLVDRLKRQVEYDKQCLSALHMELEEERNAAEIAANQAMAMITRLQEEKAALHMEALQYLRMMEEQAEHDVDALERANDLLAEKEKEIQDLEAELEYCRLNFQDEPARGKQSMNSPKNGSTLTSEVSNPVSAGGIEKSSHNNSSLPGIEDEKLYILQRLRSLEQELRKSVHHKVPVDKSDKDGSDESENGRNNQENNHHDEGHENEESHSSVQNEQVVSNGKHQAKVKSGTGNSDFVVLEDEISDLNERLKALEANCDLIQHLFNSLEKGKEPLVFIQDVAHQLQELRNLGVRRRHQSAQ